MGVLVALRVHVLNFINDVPNFVKDVPRVSKCVPRWGLDSNHF